MNTLASNINNLTSGDPLLAPLGDYGGPTQTMALRPGSPARNAAGPGNDVQQINIGALPITFTLTFNGSTTGTLNQSSTGPQVDSALEALGTIGAGNVTVTESMNGLSKIFTVTFTGTRGGINQNQITSVQVAVTTLQDGFPASTRLTDQRGFPMVGLPDIGAYEAGTLAGVPLATTLAETLPGTGPASGVTPAGDFDGDGQSNQDETTAGTILTNPTSVLRITTVVRSGGTLVISFPSVSGRTYTLWRSDSLTGAWTNTGLTTITGNGTVRQFTVSPAPVAGVPKRFFRVQVGP